MNEKYTDAYIDSVVQYLFNLRKLARRDPQTLRDLSLLEVFLQVYNWADWYEVSEEDKISIQKLLDCIYRRNPNLSLPKVIPGTFYSNVNTPQNIWTWQRIWDNLLLNGNTVVPADYYLLVVPTIRNVSASSGTTAFAVNSNVVWTATSNQPWCTITGSTSTSLSVAFTTNILAAARTASITFSGSGVASVTVTVYQAGATATLTVTPSTRTVSSASGTTTFSVVTNSTWTATSNTAWCTVTPSGNGNGTITANFSQNLSGASRTAFVTVSAPGLFPVIVSIVQEYVGIYLSVTPALRTVATTAGTTTFSVSSNLSWTAVVSGATSDWCEVTPSGTGNGTITATFLENTGISSRSVTVIVSAPGVSSVSVVVSQVGIAPTLAVAPASSNVASDSGLESYTVTSNAAWSATSNAAWCTVTPYGSENGTINAVYEQNTLSVSRTATITVSVVGLSPVQVTLVQAPPIIPGYVEFRQGYIYNWYVVTDSREITSSDDWRVARVAPIIEVDSAAELIGLRNYASPTFSNLLIGGGNSLGFNGVDLTLGRNANGTFHTAGTYPAGTIILSPLVADTLEATPTITVITSTTFTPSGSYNAGFPIRLVKNSTALANGETGTYIGNNGVEYPTICIGGKEWLAANLIETNYRTGESIPEVTADLAWSQATTNYSGARCSHNNDETTAFIYVQP